MDQGFSFTRIVVLLWCLLAIAGCSRMDTEAQPQKAALPPLEFVSAWGMKGGEPGQLSCPASFATDALGNVFIADSGSHFIDKFDPRGTPLLAFQDSWIRFPQSIAIDRGGAIYLADATQGSVFLFFPNGERYRSLRLRPRPHAENSLSVSVGDDGLIFVLDTGEDRVSAYTPRLRFLRTWRVSVNGTAIRRHSSEIAAGPDGYVYVLDAAGNRILRFTHEGRFVSEIVARPPGAGRQLGGEFAVSSSYIFVMDGDGLTLHVLSLEGNPKLDVDLTPQLGRVGRFMPALAVGSHGDLFVLDSPDARVLRYKINF